MASKTALLPLLRSSPRALSRSLASPIAGPSRSLPRLLAPRHYSSSTPGPQKDPSHPHLYYHPLANPAPGRIALSFLPHPPQPDSRTILGSLPLGGSSLVDFKENPKFLVVLHDAIRDGLGKGVAESVEFEASGRPGDGYIHITDERAIPPAGRIGETEDLIGTVLVQDNKIVPDTYEPLPSYRLVTSNGPLILPKGLDSHVLKALESIHQQESS